MQHKLDRGLGQITAAKHRIKIISLDKQQRNSASYQAGPRAPELKKQQMNMLAMYGIGQAQTEEVLSVKFAGKKGEPSYSVLIIASWMH